MDIRKEVAKRILKRYVVKHNATYHGIPVLEFNEEELLKILDMYAGLIKGKDEILTLILKVV